MPQERVSSEAGGQEPQVQAGDVAAATTPKPESEGAAPPVQEQVATQPQPLLEEQIGSFLASKQGQSAIYRLAQSMKDKELNQERLRRQQEEEKRRLDGMDAEEYGLYRRQQEQDEGKIRAGVTDQLGRLLGQMQRVALDQISSKAVREQVEAKANAGAYKSFPEFFAACVKADADHKVQTQVGRREKQLREVITKEVTAEQVGEMAPQLGTGVPVARTSEKHGRELLSEGIGELRKKPS